MRERRKQCQTRLNAMLRELSKKQNLKQQLYFLHQCKRMMVFPKGLEIRLPKNLTRCERSKSIFLNTNTKILNVAISELNRKLNRVKNNLCATKMIIEGFNLGELWYKNTIRWIEKIAIKENWKSRKRL